MPIVDYRNIETGEHREVEVPEGIDAPAKILLTDCGAFQDAAADPLPCASYEPGVWHRIDWSTPIKVPGIPAARVRDAGGVRHPGQTLPVSVSLPLDGRPGDVVTEHGHKVVKHADGTLSTLGGERIVRNNQDARLHAESCGMVRKE